MQVDTKMLIYLVFISSVSTDSGGLVTDLEQPYFPSNVPFTIYQCMAPEDHQCVLFRSYWNCTFPADRHQARISIYEGQRPDEDSLVHRYDNTNFDWDEQVPAFSSGRWMLIVAEDLGDGGDCEGELRIIAGKYTGCPKSRGLG